METFARLVLRHRIIVFVVWGLLFVAGLGAAANLSDRLNFDFSLPGQPGDSAENSVEAAYGTSSADTLLPVVTVPAGSTVEDRAADIAKIYDGLRTQFPTTRITDLASSGDQRLVTDDGRSTFALVQAPLQKGFSTELSDGLLAATQKAASDVGLTGGLTSYQMLSAGDSGDQETSVLFETLLGAVGALAVLAFVFASFLAFVPLIIAVVSILSTFLLVFLMTEFMGVSFVVQFLISLIGLGVAIDYSLLVVSRWREERAHGRTNEEATVVAVQTAGHAVLASGITVAISLVALVVVPVPFLRSMGLGGMMIPLVSVAVVLTLLPALLSTIGPRFDWPRIRKEGVAAKGWSAWARLIVRHRYPAAGVALIALGLIIAPVFGLKIGQAGSESLARTGQAYDSFTVLKDGGIGTGVLTPITLVVPEGQADAAIAATAQLPGVLTAVEAPEAKDGLSLVDVLPTQETVDSAGTKVVDRVREAAEGPVQGDVGVTGPGSVVEDYNTAVYDRMPYVLLLIAAITFILLVRTFRSILLPIKAVLLNLVSLTAVFGAVVFFWQEGHGSDALFNTSPTGAVTFWLPVLIFAFLFGLSMDYEVFILARMREEYDRTGSTSQAVITGLGRTGRLVTSAALILFFAFIALATTPGTDIKVLGTALGVGILIDATLVRALLVPALVSLLGRWNWWLPGWAATILRVEPSPLAPKQAGPWDPDIKGDPELVQT